MSSQQKREWILIVDDSTATLEVLQRNLVDEGYRVFTSTGVSQALEVLEGRHIDLVITDLKMPKVGGMDLVRHVRENLRDTAVMLITGYPSIEGAVNAVRNGADDFLAKPFTDSELLVAVERALNRLAARRSGQTQSETATPISGGLVGASESMQEVFVAIGKAAKTSATVLITGESGTGKELAARAIHYGAERSSAQFVPVNCGGIPEGLLESELFGHVKGAFTGATDSRAGFFHAADGGSIFLDEISEMSLSMQVKLLRVLQDKHVCMVGSNRMREVDVRILAATNKDLHTQVEKGSFRKDLFYRLNIINIIMPSLRERGDDIFLLARHFADKLAVETGKGALSFSDEALEGLRNYNWPGNVRELENVIQRLLVMTDGDVIDVTDLPSLMRFSALRQRGFTRTLAEVESEYIHNVLESVGGNKTKAAKTLGIDRKTLREKLKKANSDSN